MPLPDINGLVRTLDPFGDQMVWAETEISAAQARHPATADRLWRSFVLLMPTHPMMRTESVFRAHCRELLERVAHGEDTRPGTSTESCIVLSEASRPAPLNSASAGLYTRLWRQAGLPPVERGDASEHFEALEGSIIDEQEAWLRRNLHQPWRVLPPATIEATSPQQ